MEYIRRHLTVAATVIDEFIDGYIRSVFHTHRRYLTIPAILTDECTNRYLRSVFQTLTDNFTDSMYPSVCHTITDRINPSVYFKWETFFLRVISICKTIGKCFFMLLTDIATDGGITMNEKSMDVFRR
jgi:hypothetical protein